MEPPYAVTKCEWIVCILDAKCWASILLLVVVIVCGVPYTSIHALLFVFSKHPGKPDKPAGQDAGPRAPTSELVAKTFKLGQLPAGFRIARQALEEGHSGIYRYTSKAELDRIFDRTEQSLTWSVSGLEFCQVLAPVLAVAKCGHTDVSFPKDCWKSFLAKVGVFGSSGSCPRQILLPNPLACDRAAHTNTSRDNSGTNGRARHVAFIIRRATTEQNNRWGGVAYSQPQHGLTKATMSSLNYAGFETDLTSWSSNLQFSHILSGHAVQVDGSLRSQIESAILLMRKAACRWREARDLLHEALARLDALEQRTALLQSDLQEHDA